MLHAKSVSAKWMIAALVSIIAAGTLVASPAAAEEAKYLIVLDTPEGITQKVMTESELDITLRCLVAAPSAPMCTNGPLSYTGFFLSHGLALPIPSGTSTPAGAVPVKQLAFTSVLSSATTTRTFRCDVNENAQTTGIEFRCFPGSGSFPPRGSSVKQTAIGFATPSHDTTGPLAGDQTALSIYTQTGGQVLIPGLGSVTAQLIHL